MLVHLAVLALAVAVMVQSFAMPPPVLEPLGPAAFPFWISVGLIVCGIGGLLEHLYRRRMAAPRTAPAAPDEPPAVDNAWGGLIAVTVMTILYLVALQTLHAPFVWATSVYLFASSVIFAERKLLPLAALLVASIVFSVAVDIVFTKFLFLDISG